MSLEGVGNDPGTCNDGICRIRFRGFKYITDENGNITKMPQFDVLNMCLMDFANKITYTSDKDFNVVVNRYGNTQTSQDDSLASITENLALFVQDTPWIFEKYTSSLFEGEQLPILATENQCGHIKNNLLDVTVTSYLFPLAVRTTDLVAKDTREIIIRAKKYGISSNGKSGGYDKRKESSEEVTRSLLEFAGMHEVIKFLDQLLILRKQHFPKKDAKAHDVCDAFVLILETLKNKYELLEKAKGRWPTQEIKEVAVPLLAKKKKISGSMQQRQKGTKGAIKFTNQTTKEPVNDTKKRKRTGSISIVINDDEDEKPAKKKIKKRERSLKSLSDEIAETFVECAKAKNKRKRIIDDDSEEEQKKKPKKKASKKESVHAKYEQLTFM